MSLIAAARMVGGFRPGFIISTSVPSWTAAIGIACAVVTMSVGSPAPSEVTTTTVRPDSSLQDRIPAGPPESTFRSYLLPPNLSGPLTIEARSLDFDTVLKIIKILPGEEGRPILADDDGGAGMNSLIVLAAEIGATYRIEVHSMEEEWGGEFDLLVSTEKHQVPDPASKWEDDGQYWQAAMDRAKANGNLLRQARILGAQAARLLERKRYTESKDLLTRAMELRNEVRPDDEQQVGFLSMLARIQKEQGSLSEARLTLERALALGEKIAGTDSVRIVWILRDLGDVLYSSGDCAAARVVGERALRLLETKKGANEGQTFVEMTLKVHNKLGWVYSRLNELSKAESSFLEAARLAAKAYGANSPTHASMLHALALYYRNSDRLRDAEQAALQALRIEEKRGTSEDVAAAFYLHALGMIYWDQDRYAMAEDALKQGIQSCEQRLTSKGGRYSKPLLANTLQTLGDLYIDRSRYREAEEVLKRSLLIRQELELPNSLELAKSLHMMARAHRWQDQFLEAETLDRKALEIRERADPPKENLVAQSLDAVGQDLMGEGRYADALSRFERALAIREKTAGPDSSLVAGLLMSLGKVYERLDRQSEAEEALKRALRIVEKNDAQTHSHAGALNDLGVFYASQKNDSEVESFYRESVRISEKTNGLSHSETATGYQNLAALLMHKGEFKSSEELSRKALKIRRNTFGEPSPDVADSLDRLGTLYQRQGRNRKAESYLSKALNMRERTLGPSHPLTLESVNSLSAFLRSRNRTAEADALLARSKAQQN